MFVYTFINTHRIVCIKDKYSYSWYTRMGIITHIVDIHLWVYLLI